MEASALETSSQLWKASPSPQAFKRAPEVSEAMQAFLELAPQSASVPPWKQCSFLCEGPKAFSLSLRAGSESGLGTK